MPIPAFDKHGLLPVGTFDCTFAEVEDSFCWNPHRSGLFEGLKRFVDQELVPLELSAPVYVDGSFTRKKEQPADIDCVADVSHLADTDMGPVVSLFFRREWIKEVYQVDFWIKHPMMKNDLVSFFCYTGLKAGAELGLDTKHPKGILRILT